MVKRCRATEELAEALLTEAKKGKSTNKLYEKKQKASEEIIESLVKRYHADGTAIFTKGFLAARPDLAGYKKSLNESANAAQAEAKAVSLVKQQVQTNLVESKQLRDQHPSRIAAPKQPTKVKIEESLRLEESNLLDAIFAREQSML